MKIKRLSILGFKSFMERLEIAFPMGISGVVGPNGCGKSNIVDAIRWCLGEQSPKQLRGRRMEDIIFNGAGDQRPMGMAEVSIVFENGDNSFPPPFTQDPELSVTRRLYRSGESEYLINNVPCRLKDIQEIFMDTGLSNNAYSVIGQGQIGTILEQKPEETRVMLEEAAGITKYRKKVAASQRKIEQTEANLQRVEDILAEVQRQMRSLKRQAGKARRYKAVSEEIRNLELVLYANTYEQLQVELGSKKQSTDSLAEREVERSARYAQLQAKIEGMNLEMEEKESLLSTCRADYLRLQERVHKKEAGLESLTGEMKMQEEMGVRLKGEKEQITTRLSSLKDERTRLNKDLDTLKKNSRDLEAEISLEENRLKSRRESLNSVREEYEKVRGELSDGANKEAGLNHGSDYLNRMLHQITDRRSRLESELNEVQAKIEKLMKAAEGKTQAREASMHRMEEIDGAINAQDMNCQQLAETKDQTEAELKAAETELHSSESRLGSLRALTENFEGYKVGVRTIMKAKGFEPREKGRIMGLVADVIQVAPQYEQAVEAVLADKLQYVIVESQEDGKEAVEYLKQRARGRSSFFPLKDIAGGSPNERTGSGASLLKDRVTVPDSYRPLVDLLLGNTTVVEDLQTAISQWRKNGKDRGFVTLDGDMVDRRGVISGGRLTESSQGILGRKREMHELKEKVSGFAQRVADLHHQMEDITSKIQREKDALEELREEKWTCQDEINDVDKGLFRLGQEMDQLEKLTQRIKDDLAAQDKEETKHKRELVRIEEELQERKAKRQKEEEYFQEKQRELKESEAEFDELREALTQVKGDYRIMQEEQRSLLREIDRIEEYEEESVARLERIEEEISRGRERIEACEQKRVSSREELELLYNDLKSAEDLVNGADRDRQAWVEKIREQEGTADAVRNEIDELREQVNRAKMEHSEIHFKMNNLVEMVREKAALHLPQIYEQYVEADFSAADVEDRLENKKRIRQSLGEVNLTAIKEHEALKERYEFIKTQREDLISSIEDLRMAIKKINKTSLDKFSKVIQEVDGKLKEIFPILFKGGTAGLRLIDETKPLESGVLVEVQPPGKKLSHMGLLSGGEKALVAMALLFAIYMIKPSPFCLLDEVDAPLDEANIDRFNNLLREIRRASQIIMVTHNRRTMEITDRLYGVTMETAGVSKTVTVDIEGMKKQAVEAPPNEPPAIH